MQPFATPHHLTLQCLECDERNCSHSCFDSCARLSMYARLITHSCTYRFNMAVFEKFDMQCSSTASFGH
jgi:hypothetical protein